MKRRARFLGLVAVLMVSFPAAALADTVQGRVAAVSSKTLNMTVFDAQGRPYPNALHLKIDRNTRVNGVPSAYAFRRQDPVSAQVRQETPGVWRADSVSLLQSAAPVQTAAPSSLSLMDALGSPTGRKVIRGGITGAITGAVASGASGGKAGKGALIGAGVGAGAGLLEGLFSQSQSSDSQVSVATQDDTRR